MNVTVELSDGVGLVIINGVSCTANSARRIAHELIQAAHACDKFKRRAALLPKQEQVEPEESTRGK